LIVRFTTLPHILNGDVSIRPLRKEDLAPWFEYLSQRIVFKHTSWNVQSVDELSGHVWSGRETEPSSNVRFAVANSRDVLIGTAGFHTVSDIHRSAELAYDLHPDVWGRGIATTVARELVRWAHDDVGVIRVQAAVFEANKRSASVLERIGFREEGLLRSFRLLRGVPGDFRMFSHLNVDSARGID
jgi:[ribosomal protein S5]-alanine N-acetyltransferase